MEAVSDRLTEGQTRSRPRPGFSVRLAQTFGLLAGLIGILGLVGCGFHVGVFLHAWDENSPMQVNTALGLIIAAVGLTLAMHAHIRPYSGILLTLLGESTLLEYWLHIDLHIDHVLMPWSAGAVLLGGGRMGQNTATCFLILGIGFLASRRDKFQIISVGAGLVVISLGCATVIGFLAGVDSASRWGHTTRMACHSAVALAALGIGLILDVWPALKWNRKVLLPAVAGGIVGAITLLVWYGALQDNDRSLSERSQAIATDLSRTLIASLESTSGALTRFAERWQPGCAPLPETCGRDLNNYFRDYPELSSIAWLAPGSGTVIDRRDSPARPVDTAAIEAMLLPGRSGQVEFSARPGHALLLIPIKAPGTSTVMAALVDPALVAARYISTMESGWRTQLVINSFPLRKNGQASSWENAAEVKVAWRGAEIAIVAAPTRSAALGPPLADFILCVGLLMTGLFAAAVYLWLANRERLWQIAGLNFGLELKVKAREREIEETYRKAAADIELLNQGLEERVRQRTAELATANHELTTVKAKLQSILDSATQVSIIATDLKGTIQVFNAGAERMLQYRAEEMVGRHTPEILHDAHEHQVRSEELTQELGRPIEGFETYVAHPRAGEFEERQWTYVRKDGSRLPVSLVITPVRNGDGVIEGFLGIAIDITERTTLELERRLKTAELAEQTRRAEEANQAKTDFLTTVSHEIRTPMNAILGMADLLWESDLNPEQSHYVEVFRRAGSNLMVLINDLLDLSKIESGRLELEAIDFNVEDVVDQATQLVSGKAREKRLILMSRLAPGLPAVMRGDPTRLRQVLINLLGNAVKFTNAGEVVLEAQPDESGPPGKVVFSVRDTGIGIAKDKLDKIFDAFTQENSSTTRRYGGTGLGLCISRKIVELMGGSLTVTSTIGRGSAFRFAAAFAPSKDRSEARPLEIGELFGRRALIVDDNATNQFILTESLSTWGMECKSFSSPKDALLEIVTAKQSGKDFALAVIDRSMPDMDGFEMASRIAAIAAELPVIMLTSEPQFGDLARRQELGLVGCAVKPVRRTELFRLVCQALTLNPAQPGTISSDREALPGPLQAPASPALKILVAEDAQENRALLKAYLKNTSHSLLFAEDGKSAIEMFSGEQFDLVLMDILMPVMDGLTATEAIRAMEKSRDTARTPIVALSANTRPVDVARCMAAGCDAHLAKPISKQRLLAAIDEFARAGPQPLVEAASPISIEVMEGFEVLVHEYLKNSRQMIRELSELLEKADFEQVRRLAHNIKGSAGSYGFRDASTIGAMLEEATVQNDSERMQRSLAQLAEYFSRVQLVEPTVHR